MSEVPQWGTRAKPHRGSADDVPQKLKQFADIVMLKELRFVL